MREEILNLLNLTRLPGRLTAEQAAPLLGFASHDIPVLVKARMLKPLGNPQPNAVKFFAAVDVEKFAKDEGWLGRATRALYSYWESRNQKRIKTSPANVLSLAALGTP
jgi:hypothetical protein